MRTRLAARTRSALRVLLVAVLVYPLTAATTGTDDSRYADYMVSSDSGSDCGTSPRPGPWICWYVPSP